MSFIILIIIIIYKKLTFLESKQLKCYDCTAYKYNIEDCTLAKSETTTCEHTCLQASFWIDSPAANLHEINYVRGCGPEDGCESLNVGLPQNFKNYTCIACTKNLCNGKPFETKHVDEDDGDDILDLDGFVRKLAHFLVD